MTQGFVIRHDLVRGDKPLDELTSYDVPRGFDPEDVCAVDETGELILTRAELEEFHRRRERNKPRFLEALY
jgi:hypothetical protein